VRRLFVSAAAASAAGVALLALTMSALAAGGAGVIKPWGLQNEGGDKDVPRKKAVKHALNNDLLTAHVRAYKGDVAAMKRANPRLIILAYMNALYAHTKEGDKYPADWYMRDSKGDRVRNRNTGNWLMNPAKQGWIDNRIAECKSRMRESGYDGCSLDMLGLASLSLGYVNARPAHEDGSLWTADQWLDATARLARSINKAVKKRLVYGNGLSTAGLYFGQNTRRLAVQMNGGIAEAWLRGSKTGVKDYPGEKRWRKEIKMIRDVQRMHKPILTLTKLWVRATDKQQDKWRRFALGSFLIATNGKSYFFFSSSFGASRVADHAWYHTRLGSPLGRHRKKQGVYTRNFTRGKVIVNPTGSFRKFRLSKQFVNLSGARVGRTVTLAPHGAQILRRPR
jgi:hypothetical protein